MRTNSIDHTAVESLRELAEAKERYEEQLGWPVTIDARQLQLVLPVGTVADAITMPSALADEVQAALRIAMLAGPVISVPGDPSRTFLTQPGNGYNIDVALELGTAAVGFVPPKRHVIIPLSISIGPNPDSYGWFECPRWQGPLPPWPAVVATTRRIVASRLVGDRS